MRILFCTQPEKTIFMTMVPLAWALRAAGHDVRVAAQPDFVDTITSAGLTAVPVGRNQFNWRLMSMAPPDDDAGDRVLPVPYNAAIDPSVSAQDMVAGYRFQVDAWHHMENFGLFADLVSFCRSWQPDLVLWEPLTYAGAIAAEACGAAHGRLMWTIDLFGTARERFLQHRATDDIEDPLRHWLEAFAGKYGVPWSESLALGQFTIDQIPPSLKLQAADHPYLDLRYTPYGGPAVVPQWLSREPERQRVAITLGLTSTDRFTGYRVDLPQLLSGLGDLPQEFVVTVADKVRESIGAVAPNIRLERYVPLQQLVAGCAAVVNHAGPGTYLTAALAGIPQLLLPFDFDEPELARRAAQHGGSLLLDPDVAGVDEILEGIGQLFVEPLPKRAGDLADEMRAQPGPAAVGAELAAIVDAARQKVEVGRA